MHNKVILFHNAFVFILTLIALVFTIVFVGLSKLLIKIEEALIIYTGRSCIAFRLPIGGDEIRYLFIYLSTRFCVFFCTFLKKTVSDGYIKMRQLPQ